MWGVTMVRSLTRGVPANLVKNVVGVVKSGFVKTPGKFLVTQVILVMKPLPASTAIQMR